MEKESSRDIDVVNVDGKEDQEPEEVSDMEWMRRRMLASEIKTDKEFEQSDEEMTGADTKKEEVKVRSIVYTEQQLIHRATGSNFRKSYSQLDTLEWQTFCQEFSVHVHRK
jgi:hypothetical protein